MLKRTGIILCTLCFFVLMGGHWAVLQTVAWAEMIRTYSKDATIQQALEKTFDGKHPCKMCKQISAAKKQEQSRDQNQSETLSKLLAILCAVAIRMRPRRHLLGNFDLFRFFHTRSSTPPVPPPLAV